MAVSEEGILNANRGDELVDLPPGFRFHPTDEEIITFYLKEKVLNSNFTAAAIGEADLNKCEPWDLPRRAKMGENNEFYFFCQRDRKYPTGMRTNRATESGYWKATGKDKEIYKGKGCLVGMKKTLVFYRGRAPRGEKTNWVMHEYRLEGKYSYYNLPKSAKDEWVVCRVLHKNTTNVQQEVVIKKPIEELIRMDSLENMENLLDFSSLPPLLDPGFPGQPGPSFFGAGENEFKPIINNITTNNSYHPRITLQNPNFPYPDFVSGSGYGSSSAGDQAILRSFVTGNSNTNNVHYDKNTKAHEHSLISVSQETCLSSDVNASGTPEISSAVSASKQETTTMPSTVTTMMMMMRSSGNKSYDDLGDLGILWD